MNQASTLWKQLKVFEQRGDLQKQAEVLSRALGAQLPPQILSELLKMAQERAALDAEKNPPPLYRLLQDRQVLQLCDSRSGEVIKELNLPRESGLIPQADLTWNPLGQKKMMVLSVQRQTLQVLQLLADLEPLQTGLLLNSSYAYLNLNPPEPLMSWFCRSFSHDAMPLEPVRSLPYDLFLSARHPLLAVADRGAGKLHLIQREPLRMQRSWPILPPPNKKALSVVFHPDGRRIFVSGGQPGLLTMIDRGMAQKKLPVPQTHLISNLALSNRGDLLYALAVHPDTRRPDLWVLDTQKFERQNSIPLDGEAFSTGADARDLLELTPDGKFAVVMVSRNQPALFTPCLLLIELATGKILDQKTLRPDEKPVNLAFPARQLVNPRFRLLPMLLHGGFGLTEESLKQAFGVEQI